MKILGVPEPGACWEIPFGEKNTFLSFPPLTMKKEAQHSVGPGIWEAQTSHSVLPQPTHRVTASSEWGPEQEISAEASDCRQAALSDGGGYSPPWNLWPVLLGVAVLMLRVPQQGLAILGATSGMPQGPAGPEHLVMGQHMTVLLELAIRSTKSWGRW